MNVNLYVMRKENKLRQKDVAKLIGISEQSYYLKENRKRDFTESEMIKLTEVFGRTLNELFGR